MLHCLVFAAAGPWMPGDGDVSPMDPTIAYGAAPNMVVFAPDGGAGFDLVGTIDVPLGGTISRYASTGFYSGILHVLASALVTYFTAINCDFKQHFRTGLHVTVPVAPKGCYGTVTWST